MNLHYLSLVVVGFLVWFMGYCQGAPARPNFADATNKMKVYCGTILADALEAVCKGNYQTMRPGNVIQLEREYFWQNSFFPELGSFSNTCLNEFSFLSHWQPK